MSRRRILAQLTALASITGLLTLAACTIGPFRITFPTPTPKQPAIVLRWCDQARDVLCVLGFGLEPPDRMAITLLSAPGLPLDLIAHARWNGQTGSYPCEPTNADGTLFVCSGPLIPLGSGLQLEVVAVADKTVIARGDFVLHGLALPTVPVSAGMPPTDAVTITPRSAPSLAPGTPYPNPTSNNFFNLGPTSTSNPAFRVVPTTSSNGASNPASSPTPNSRPNPKPNPPSP